MKFWFILMGITLAVIFLPKLIRWQQKRLDQAEQRAHDRLYNSDGSFKIDLDDIDFSDPDNWGL